MNGFTFTLEDFTLERLAAFVGLLLVGWLAVFRMASGLPDS
jgi:hypothetical protein